MKTARIVGTASTNGIIGTASTNELTRDWREWYDGAMPRIGRVVAVGTAHHVTQRGNNRQAVFFTAGDRKLYPGFLKRSAELHGLAIRAYCLMTKGIRSYTWTGRPLGSDSFISKLEVALNRRLRKPPMGRPRKHPEDGGAGRRGKGKSGNARFGPDKRKTEGKE